MWPGGSGCAHRRCDRTHLPFYREAVDGPGAAEDGLSSALWDAEGGRLQLRHHPAGVGAAEGGLLPGHTHTQSKR